MKPNIASIQALRTQLLNSGRATPITEAAVGRTLPVPPSLRHKMISFHNPDVDLLALSMHDPRLASLNLQDKWLQSKLQRESDFLKRGKAVRVSALTGRVKPVAGEEKGKKKKRK
ncbi:hypothetical protein HDU84_009675 [Entophlyctis sp. JEL0112]|nr:hypothetical protein HDU84_009675 [Entophlyctis sp. JEL0112]